MPPQGPVVAVGTPPLWPWSLGLWTRGQGLCDSPVPPRLPDRAFLLTAAWLHFRPPLWAGSTLPGCCRGPSLSLCSWGGLGPSTSTPPPAWSSTLTPGVSAPQTLPPLDTPLPQPGKLSRAQRLGP